MIAVQCLDISKKIEELRRARTISKEIQGFKERQNKLAELITRAGKTLSSKQLFDNEKIGSIPAPQCISQLRDIVKKLQGSFMDNPGSILEPNSLKQIELGINNACTEIEENLKITWESYKSKNLTNINPDLLTVLVKIPGFNDNAKKIIEKVKEIYQYHSSYPTTKQELDNFVSRKSLLISAWNKLDSQNIPPDVWSFLRNAVTEEGTPLTTLTEEVFKWLRDHGVENSFSIKLTS